MTILSEKANVQLFRVLLNVRNERLASSEIISVSGRNSCKHSKAKNS